MKKFISVVKNYLKRSDTLLLVLCLTASLIGVLLIASAINHSGARGPIIVQLGAIIIGIFLYLVFSIIDVDIIAEKWRPLTIMGLLLILSLRWLGTDAGGNRSWIRFWGIGIQPAEFVKIVFIISLAHIITRFKEAQHLDSPLAVILLGLFFLIHFGVIVVITGDTGSALVYLFIFVVMLFASGLKYYWFLGAAAVLALTSPYIWYYLLTDNYRTRILAILVPGEVDPTGLGVTWQTNISKSAIASGGLLGEGLFHGTSTQSGALPLQSSDFIFSVAGEELGLLGCAAITALLILIVVRCVWIGIKSQSSLGALVCIGIGSMLAFQILENIGMCIGVGPVIGLTLPFISYGGSSIVTVFAAMGIVSGVRMRPKPTMFLR